MEYHLAMKKSMGASWMNPKILVLNAKKKNVDFYGFIMSYIRSKLIQMTESRWVVGCGGEESIVPHRD